MSEERSWAEDTVELGTGDRAAPSEPRPAPPSRRRRPEGRRAAAAIGVAGAVVIVLALLGGAGDGGESPETVEAEPERSAPVERKTTASPLPSLHRPVRRRAGSLAIGLARRAPKPSETKPAPAPAPAEPEAEPTYEPAPEPVAEPAPTPEASPAPTPGTPAAVEFGM